MDMAAARENTLGVFLRDRRGRLDPASFGIGGGRRRTSGLRREEVAARANISATWYTWLEQGRGGAPSADVLDRISRALLLTELEREHLFLLALGRPPEARFRATAGVTPRLQRVLDALDPCPAVIRTAIWDVIAWNRAATVLLTDYGARPPDERNILRRIFLDSAMRESQFDWESTARFVVAAFRVDAARAGANGEVAAMVERLRQESAEFRRMWEQVELGGGVAEHTKHIRHPVLGTFAFDHSAFAVDGRPDLSLVIYNPATPEDAQRVAAAVART